jgi:hypothetical protein
MKPISIGALAKRSPFVIAMVVILCAAGATSSGSLLAQEIQTNSNNPGQATSVFYTTSAGGPNGGELFAIEVSGSQTTTRHIGPIFGGACASLALSASGTLYSMCGSLFGEQQLATIDRKTGRANLFGVKVPGLAVMALAFAGNGILYAVGDCNPDPNAQFECTRSTDPNYNSLYRVDEKTGAFTRVGATGAAQFFMDLAFDREGKLFGVTTTLNHSAIPAILYRIDLATGTATNVVNLVGSNSVMGLAFGRDGRLYGTDFVQNPGIYLIDMNRGFETAIGVLPFGLSSSLELAAPQEDEVRGLYPQ